jgi:hypothetical protein
MVARGHGEQIVVSRHSHAALLGPLGDEIKQQSDDGFKFSLMMSPIASLPYLAGFDPWRRLYPLAPIQTAVPQDLFPQIETFSGEPTSEFLPRRRVC